MHYVKRPSFVEAFQWTGDEHQAEDPVWIVDAIRAGTASFEGSGADVVMKLVMGKGNPATVQQGWWVVRDAKGAIFTMKPEDFAAVFEPAPELVEEQVGLEERIRRAINTVSRENESDTPDFILAGFLMVSLRAFEAAVKHRRDWGAPPKVNITLPSPLV